MTINKKLQEDFNNVVEQTHHMCVAILENMKRSKKGTLQKNKELLEQVIKLDTKINQFEIEIRRSCEQILLRWQPVSKGLRLILSLLTGTSNFEKIGDLIGGIARISLKYVEKEYIYPTINLEKLFDYTISTFNYSVAIFLHKKRDEEIFQDTVLKLKNLNKKIVNDLLQLLKDNSEYSEQIVDFILIARNLKLICDLILHIVSLSSYKENGLFDDTY